MEIKQKRKGRENVTDPSFRAIFHPLKNPLESRFSGRFFEDPTTLPPPPAATCSAVFYHLPTTLES